MGIEHVRDLKRFLQPFGPEITEFALWLRSFVWNLYPETNELIYDNYNALTFGWSPTEKLSHVFCNIAVIRTNKHIQFGFYWGSKINDPEKKLIGNGKQYRYILTSNKKDFPKEYIKKMIKEGYEYSLSKVKDPTQLIKGCTIVKSVSPVKREKKKHTNNKLGVK